MELSGTFQITDWQENVEKELSDGAKLSNAIVQQSYTGDLTGSSEVRYQLYYDAHCNAIFVGFETLTLNADHAPATLVLQHSGAFKNGVASSQFTVVASSADASLLGRSGSFKSTEGGKAEYQLCMPRIG